MSQHSRQLLAGLLLAASLASPMAVAHAQAGPAPPVSRPDPEQVRAEIERILASGEYQLEQKERGRAAWLERALRWMGRLLSGRAFESLPPIATIGIAVGLIILLGLIVYHVLSVIRPALRRPVEPPQTRLLPDELREKKPGDLRRLAAQHAAKGDYRAALRWAYLALLVALDSGGLIEYDQRKTNWEYLRQLERDSALFAPARELTSLFDRKWYGHELTTASDYELSERLTRQALEALPS
ncbi:MAG: DUF4129 domain-containing protein [Armatimonadota bacterium]